jgi:hypothetical protein
MENNILDHIEKEDLPNLYSKFSILITSALFSPIFGMTIYITNLSRLDLKKHILGTVITILVYSFLANKVMSSFANYRLLLLIPFNLLGGIILIIPFWKHHINDQRYNPKFAWIPLLMIVGIAIVLFGGLYLSKKE